jgi:hypothetical protein
MMLRYTIDEFPSLVYFEQEIPSVFDGDLENGREVLAWVVDLLTGADIEEVQTQTPRKKMSSLLVFNRLYRLEILSVLLVFSTPS